MKTRKKALALLLCMLMVCTNLISCGLDSQDAGNSSPTFQNTVNTNGDPIAPEVSAPDKKGNNHHSDGEPSLPDMSELTAKEFPLGQNTFERLDPKDQSTMLQIRTEFFDPLFPIFKEMLLVLQSDMIDTDKLTDLYFQSQPINQQFRSDYGKKYKIYSNEELARVLNEYSKSCPKPGAPIENTYKNDTPLVRGNFTNLPYLDFEELGSNYDTLITGNEVADSLHQTTNESDEQPDTGLGHIVDEAYTSGSISRLLVGDYYSLSDLLMHYGLYSDDMEKAKEYYQIVTMLDDYRRSLSSVQSAMRTSIQDTLLFTNNMYASFTAPVDCEVSLDVYVMPRVFSWDSPIRTSAEFEKYSDMGLSFPERMSTVPFTDGEGNLIPGEKPTVWYAQGKTKSDSDPRRYTCYVSEAEPISLYQYKSETQSLKQGERFTFDFNIDLPIDSEHGSEFPIMLVRHINYVAPQTPLPN